MASLPGVPDPEGRVLHGFEHNEDAVILRTPPAGMALVQTVDVLSPLGNNPRLFGQVAAANALSDVYAVGGVPWSAMNIAAFPAQDVPLEVFAEILAGGLEKIVEAGAVLAGGHTLEDAEIKYGLSVTGYVDPGAVASNAGLRPGDALVLTKPLGTGVLATAIKAQWDGSGKAEADLYRWATHLNANAAEVLRAMNLKAATDITGFGLGGHLLEMARGSRVVVEIDTASLPFIDNVEAFASDGLIPAGSYANRRHCSCRTFVSPDVDSLRATLVFDAQTSGGLVLAVPQERVEEALERLAALGEPGWLVGHVLPLKDGPQRLLSESLKTAGGGEERASSCPSAPPPLFLRLLSGGEVTRQEFRCMERLKGRWMDRRFEKSI